MSATRKTQILHSLTFLLIFGLLPAVTSTMMAGGQTEEKDATEEVQHIVDQVIPNYNIYSTLFLFHNTCHIYLSTIYLIIFIFIINNNVYLIVTTIVCLLIED